MGRHDEIRYLGVFIIPDPQNFNALLITLSVLYRVANGILGKVGQ